MFSARSGKLGFTLGAAAACALVTAALASSRPSALTPPSAKSAYAARPLLVPLGIPAAAGVQTAASPGAGLCVHPPIRCYAPADIKQIYDFPTGPGAPDGSGQTIVVVVAFGSPTLESDVDAFDSAFGLPAARLTVVGPNGSGDQTDPNVRFWAVETSFDVEWAHAMAPGADIVLVVARSDDSQHINRALMRVLPRYPGAIVSQSFGADETFVEGGFIDERHAHLLYVAAAVLGETVLASTGDLGAGVSDFGATGPTAQYPASDPFVTAVGGTQGSPHGSAADPNVVDGLWVDGHYGDEEVWHEDYPFSGAGGGAPSTLFPAPSYQSGVSGYSKRTVPDVAVTASALAGLLTVFDGGFGEFGGTSTGPPIWAGIFALANQERVARHKGPLGFANPALYAIYGGGAYTADFHDVVKGDNVLDPSIGGFGATSGYDLATGLGSPDVGNLLDDLVAAPGSGLAMTADEAADATCRNEQLTGTYDDVSVQRGSWCDLAGATVLGDVRADGATGLGITSTEILGALQASNVSGAADPSHPGANVICNSVVWQRVQIRQSSKSAPWSIGGAGCPAGSDLIGGTGSVIGDDLRFTGNGSPTNEIAGNTVVNDIDCERNGGVTGNNNQAGTLAGQCSGLGTATGSDD